MGRTDVLEWTLDEPAMTAFAADFAMALRAGDCVCLRGDLGAGKTTFARAVIRTLCGDIAGTLDVPSPTFTLVQPYPATPPLIHADAYRIDNVEEAAELDFDDALERGIILLEWPDKIAEALPEDRATLTFEEPEGHPEMRRLSLSGSASLFSRLQRSLSIRAFLDEAWTPAARRTPLVGDASARAYENIVHEGQARVFMNAPRTPDGPAIRDGKPYSRIAHLAEDVTPFVAVAGALREAGFAAPEIHAADLDEGFVLLEHLGDGSVLDENGAPVPERYGAAMECLAALQSLQWPSAMPASDTVMHHVPRFDREAFLIEAELLIDWYAPDAMDRQATAAERAKYLEIWTGLHDTLGGCGDTIILRDFHSPNIIWRPDAQGTDRIGLIDFQDAMIGSPAYDVMSIARDARVDIPPQLETQLLETYVRARRIFGEFDEAAFHHEAAIVAAQRACKILGIFVRLNQRDGKPAYLKHLPRMRDYLARSLAHPALGALADLLADMGLNRQGGPS